MASLSAIATWDLEADVVILGCGLAGMVSALEARQVDPNATVIILEKMSPADAGGNTRVSGQSLSFPTDPAAYRRYQEAMNQPNPIPERLMSAWIDARMEQKVWVERKAAEVGFVLAPWGNFGAEFPSLPGSECIEDLYTLMPAPGPGNDAPRVARTYPSGVYLCFKAHLDRMPEIKVHHSTRASDLVYDQDTREVFGVVAESGGTTIAVKARRAVILATGGFEANPEMLANYCGYSSDIRPYGSPANTGDGIKMLQRVGAKLWHMRNNTESGGIHPAVAPPGQSALIRNSRPKATSWMDIGGDGRRFYPESGGYHDTHFKYKVSGHWEDVPTARAMPVHMILDQTTMSTDQLAFGTLTWGAIVEGYQWSADNAVEVQKGWIHKAGSIAELAGLIGRDPDALVEEVDRYNAFARAGHDPLFNRPAESMSPIVTAPYYALAVFPGLVCTTGGGMRDENGRVLDMDEKPIPRLYEAGELGSFHANLYQNGSFLTEAMFSGRWAGASAVRETDWER